LFDTGPKTSTVYRSSSRKGAMTGRHRSGRKLRGWHRLRTMVDWPTYPLQTPSGGCPPAPTPNRSMSPAERTCRKWRGDLTTPGPLQKQKFHALQVGPGGNFFEGRPKRLSGQSPSLRYGGKGAPQQAIGMTGPEQQDSQARRQNCALSRAATADCTSPTR
jgi:hypothetical protein